MIGILVEQQVLGGNESMGCKVNTLDFTALQWTHQYNKQDIDGLLVALSEQVMKTMHQQI